jgi:hypothetical protein
MVGTGADNSYAYPVALVPAGEAIDNVDAVPGVEVVDSTLTVDTPDLDEALAKRTRCARDGLPHGSMEVYPSCRRADAGQPSPRTATCRDANSIGYAASVHDVCRQNFTSQYRGLT